MANEITQGLNIFDNNQEKAQGIHAAIGFCLGYFY